MQLLLTILSGMSNSVDADQEQSDLGLHALHILFLSENLSKILGHLLYPEEIFSFRSDMVVGLQNRQIQEIKS